MQRVEWCFPPTTCLSVAIASNEYGKNTFRAALIFTVDGVELVILLARMKAEFLTELTDQPVLVLIPRIKAGQNPSFPLAMSDPNDNDEVRRFDLSSSLIQPSLSSR